MKKTAVVILNYNGEAFLRKFLPSVIEYSNGAKVIVADNASTDASITVLKEQFGEVEIIQLDQNLGFAGGYNEALTRVEAEYMVLLNSDVEVTKNWLKPLERFLDENPIYAACQPKIKDYNKKDMFEYAGAAGGFIDTLGYPYCRGRIFDTIEQDQGQYDQPLDIFWASGACMMIRASVYKGAGGLDEDFFAHMEEIDLCWRIYSLHMRICCIPSCTVYHVGGGTLSKINPRKTYLNFRNGLFLMIKNLPSSSLMTKLPLRIVLDWIAMLKFVLEGQFSHAMAILKAHLHCMLSVHKIIKKREMIAELPSRRSIIWDFYVRKKRNFSALQ